MNPFHTAHSRIISAVFDGRVRASAKKHLWWSIGSEKGVEGTGLWWQGSYLGHNLIKASVLSLAYLCLFLLLSLSVSAQHLPFLPFINSILSYLFSFRNFKSILSTKIHKKVSARAFCPLHLYCGHSHLSYNTFFLLHDPPTTSLTEFVSLNIHTLHLFH